MVCWLSRESVGKSNSNGKKTTTQHDDDKWIPNRYANRLADQTTTILSWPEHKHGHVLHIRENRCRRGYKDEEGDPSNQFTSRLKQPHGQKLVLMMIIDNLLPFQQQQQQQLFFRSDSSSFFSPQQRHFFLAPQTLAARTCRSQLAFQWQAGQPQNTLTLFEEPWDKLWPVRGRRRR